MPKMEKKNQKLLILFKGLFATQAKSGGVFLNKRDGDISWTMTSRGHYLSKWATSRGHSQRVTFRGHFW